MKHNALTYALGVGALTSVIVLAIASAWIGFTLNDACSRSKKDYAIDDCTLALMQQVDDQQQAFGRRNDAIWALGQRGDDRALPLLEKYRSGTIPDREPWNQTLSQYELEKAIHLVEGGANGATLLRTLVPSR